MSFAAFHRQQQPIFLQNNNDEDEPFVTDECDDADDCCATYRTGDNRGFCCDVGTEGRTAAVACDLVTDSCTDGYPECD